MNENIAEIVHPVIDYGLKLRAYLNAGNRIDLEREQAKLQDLLLSDEESRLQSEFGQEKVSQNKESFNDRRRMTSRFLGIRYALVCWLDEIFTINENSSHLWTEHKLEAKLYGTNDRAWKFWEQAQIAQTRDGSSALEVFYLCVNLGFRGDLRDQPEKLRSWENKTKLRLGKVEELNFPFRTETNFQYVPSLEGATRFRRMAITCWVALIAIIPLVSFALIRKFGE